jgi:hypothetical protein
MKMQPIQAFDHPSFKNMIDVAARATKGVNIPGRKVTRKHVIELFKKNLHNLRLKIMVSTTHHWIVSFFVNQYSRVTTPAL